MKPFITIYRHPATCKTHYYIHGKIFNFFKTPLIKFTRTYYNLKRGL